MNKIENRTYDETYYEEVLANGLDVVVWHKPDYTTTSCIFAAPYGSLDMDQKDDQGNAYHFPSGIAHFLEHKLFESDHGDVMKRRIAEGSGTSVNDVNKLVNQFDKMKKAMGTVSSLQKSGRLNEDTLNQMMSAEKPQPQVKYRYGSKGGKLPF